MKNETQTATNSKAERMANLQRMIENAIAARPPSPEATFAEAFDMVEIAIANKVPQKEIIEMVNKTCGLKLHALSFRTLLSNEREARKLNDHRVTCPTCRQMLSPVGHKQPERAETIAPNAAQQQEVA